MGLINEGGCRICQTIQTWGFTFIRERRVLNVNISLTSDIRVKY